jgi:hypothetical protein
VAASMTRFGMEMEERISPSRPHRLGTRRRAPRQAAQGSKVGAPRSAGRRAPSLDNYNQLATSFADLLQKPKTKQDRDSEQRRYHKILTESYYKIWQRHARKGASNECRSCGGTGKSKIHAERPCTRCKGAGKLAPGGTWEKEHFRIRDCQAEWIAYRADCCKGATRPIAVPVGCNHRLCPLCSATRAENARKRIRRLFDRLTHPVLITLTIPNLTKIRKHDYTRFRQCVNQFIKQQRGWIVGGVYSLETTFNRTEKTFHIHVHILADVTAALPQKTEKIIFAGVEMYAFTLQKLRLEYDWLRLWSREWGKKIRVDASSQRKAGEAFTFRAWIESTRAHDNKIFKTFDVDSRRYVKRTDLSSAQLAEFARREEWNRKHRRVIDIKPVIDRDGAAFEVLKYITKVAAFCDLPEVVEEFMDAVRGARLIQTFGSWYGVKLEADANEHDWSEHKCECGLNIWSKMGIFHHDHVRMDPDGRWRLRDGLDWQSMGTVAKPKIPALAGRESG